MFRDKAVTAPMNGIAELHPGKVFALQNIIELDGRVAHYPVSARGFAPCHCYLLREDDGALLVDTGFAAHGAMMISQLESLVGQTIPLSLTMMRINDFMSVGNSLVIARHFRIEQCYGMTQNAARSLDFSSHTVEEAAENVALLPLKLITGNEWIEVGHSGRRKVKLNQSPMRLINTRWMYDPESRILFTSDMFAHSWGQQPDETWFIDAGNDATTEEDVRRFLLSTRYWWLEGAKTDDLRQGIDRIFEQFDVQAIAPSYGKILRGGNVVARHHRMLDEVLRKLDRRCTPPRYVARNEEHYA
ncbi:MBL fold metallo-hydrolase [Roseomonas elaeocarpi]|uniref:MBL fold metallo-hydrolase n=1 Tax=Roseomonas elaeocarpi TaxID=907779 RepID=A0ABV6JNA8_9PROT